MKRVLLDAELRAKLQGLNGPIELHDEAGHVLARVFPVPESPTGESTASPAQENKKVPTTQELLAQLGEELREVGRPRSPRNINQAAYPHLKPHIDRTYPAGRFVAIVDGQVAADAATF